MTPIASEGICLFCQKTFKKAGISRHLNTHLEEKAKLNTNGKSFFLKVEQDTRWGSSPYFLCLWIDGQTKMEQLDDFLREIWLECCGHMSSFTIKKNARSGGGMFNYFEAQDLLEKGKIKAYETMMEQQRGEVPKSRKTKDVFTKELKIEYKYDYGSTTNLSLTVIGEYSMKADEGIVLLSRNEPLAVMCELCHEKPAVEICSVCMCHDVPSEFCITCKTKHAKTCSDFADYAAMPVVNSPRMGVCAYEGGTIDTKRDTPYKK